VRIESILDLGAVKMRMCEREEIRRKAEEERRTRNLKPS